MSVDDVLRLLGFDPANFQTLPLFNDRVDMTGEHDPTDHPDWFAAKAPDGSHLNGTPLALRWHQYIGVLAMLNRCFAGEPIMLFDEVGVGKTIQVIALICLLIHFHECFKERGSFPGGFGKSFTLL